MCVFARVNAWWGEDLLGYKRKAYIHYNLCVLMSCLECNLHLETCVCVCVCLLMSMLGGGRTFLAIKERHISIIIQMSSEST